MGEKLKHIERVFAQMKACNNTTEGGCEAYKQAVRFQDRFSTTSLSSWMLKGLSNFTEVCGGSAPVRRKVKSELDQAFQIELREALKRNEKK